MVAIPLGDRVADNSNQCVYASKWVHQLIRSAIAYRTLCSIPIALPFLMPHHGRV